MHSFSVKDKVYKVVRDHTNDKLFVQEYQVLNIRKTGRLTCFRTTNNDWSKGQWSFSRSEVGITPEEAIAIFEREINMKIAFNQRQLDDLLKCKQEMSILQGRSGAEISL